MRQPETSTFFSVASIESAATCGTASDGDLWPSCWADDGALYTACGDGLGFSVGPWSDVVVNRIDGTPESGLTGVRLAAGRDVAPVWGDPDRFNAKPTGMVAVDGNGDGHDELYLAVQDLGYGPGEAAFNEAPTAGIVRSDDYGRTWTHVGPQFTDHVFTTIWFCDFGRSNHHADVLNDLDPQGGAGYVYAFGTDHNWRTSYSGVVPDPTALYLARVPAGRIQDRSAWEFFAGAAGSHADGIGRPTWTTDAAGRVPVLVDERRRYEGYAGAGAPPAGSTLIGQGGVVYNPGLRRFLYTSWTEFTFELYDAPTPWGPWRHVMCRDFGPFPWQGPASPHASHGGYATTVPSKFISADGRDCWLQSNWFVGSGAFTGRTYEFSLRRLRLDPATDQLAPQPAGNLADPATGARPVFTACRSGQAGVLHDGRTDRAEDSWTGQPRELDVWGYTWPAPIRMNRVELVHGPWDYLAGWFRQPPRIEVRRAGRWEPVVATTTPPYSCGPEATNVRRYVFDFPEQVADGVRVAGPPAGGAEPYTSMAELSVWLVEDGEP